MNGCLHVEVARSGPRLGQASPRAGESGEMRPGVPVHPTRPTMTSWLVIAQLLGLSPACLSQPQFSPQGCLGVPCGQSRCPRLPRARWAQRFRDWTSTSWWIQTGGQRCRLWTCGLVLGPSGPACFCSLTNSPASGSEWSRQGRDPRPPGRGHLTPQVNSSWML